MLLLRPCAKAFCLRLRPLVKGVLFKACLRLVCTILKAFFNRFLCFLFKASLKEHLGNALQTYWNSANSGLG